MFTLPIRRAAQVATVIALAAGGTGTAAYDKAVALSVDGRTTQVHAFGRTVGDVLDRRGIRVGEHDVVVPSVTTAARDGQKIVVRYGRKLTLTVDGKPREFWTTATTLDAALAELGMRDLDGARLSASRSQALGRQGLSVDVVTPKSITVVVDHKTRRLTSTEATLKDALDEAKISLRTKDRVSPAVSTPLKDGLKATIKRVKVTTVKRTASVPYTTVEKRVSDRYVGDSETVRAGKAGTRTSSVSVTWVDGKVESTKTLSSKVTTAPVARIVEVGTKAKPAPKPKPAPEPSPAPAPKPSTPAPKPSAPAPSPSPSTSSGSTSGAGLNLANAAMWDRIAQCESTGNWSINTGNGYYGGLQFDIPSWLANGGDDFASRPDLASREEQITVANRYYAKAGLNPWGCAHAA